MGRRHRKSRALLGLAAGCLTLSVGCVGAPGPRDRYGVYPAYPYGATVEIVARSVAAYGTYRAADRLADELRDVRRRSVRGYGRHCRR